MRLSRAELVFELKIAVPKFLASQASRLSVTVLTLLFSPHTRPLLVPLAEIVNVGPRVPAVNPLVVWLGVGGVVPGGTVPEGKLARINRRPGSVEVAK